MATTPADINVSQTIKWNRKLETAHRGWAPSHARHFKNVHGTSPHQASEGWRDLLYSLGGTAMKSPTAPWHGEKMPQILHIPGNWGNWMMGDGSDRASG